ncbi:hypothetical protein WK66_19905 [Burkholderia ubonensis]|nr:hypothetical protein WK60_05820 [Burkholderia ubonensis]KVU43806.1 hypothetical protein WK66_19905 [Burkholderia ubonensis]
MTHGLTLPSARPGHAIVALEIRRLANRRTLLQMARRRTEEHALPADGPMREHAGKELDAADPRRDVDAFLDRIDEAVGERRMQLQARMTLGEIEQQHERGGCAGRMAIDVASAEPVAREPDRAEAHQPPADPRGRHVCDAFQ